MITRTVPHIKRAQKESSIVRIIAPCIYTIIQENSDLQGLSVTRVSLSRDKSLATVYLYIPGGPDAYKKALKTVVLYKPALRKALADQIPGRYTCDIRFAYDTQLEQTERLEALINQAIDRDAHDQ